MEQNDPIHPDEIILRRVREEHMGTGTPRLPLPDAFDPDRDKDGDGLSVYREKYHNAEAVAAFRTKGKKPSWVVKITARSISDYGLTLRADPRPPEYGLPARPGHALIVEMNSQARKSNSVEQWKQQLLSSVIGVEGGANGFAAPTAPPQS
ncbi:MAG: hypothetical protein IT436_08080 [Phycisphaerales bacterium]|nr:hypothetical protein [Phycisphaerales bacterium]